MKRTTATGAVGGLHVDRIAGVQSGTRGIAEDRNNLQEELAHPVELLGVALDGDDQYQLEKSIIGLSKQVGEMYFTAFDEDAVAWGDARNNASPSNPRYNPIVKMWDSDKSLAAANYPLLVPKLRAEKAKAWSGTAYVTDHTVSVSGSTVTGSGTAWDNLLAAWAEDVLVHGGYTSHWLLNIAGTDYAVTNVTPGSHTATVTGSPATGSQTAICYQFRVSGSTTSARLYKATGRALMSPDGVTLVPGSRRRNHMQGHWHSTIDSAAATPIKISQVTNGSAAGVTTRASGTAGVTTDIYAGNAITDGTNGTPRTGLNTEPDSLTGYLVMHVGVLL